MSGSFRKVVRTFLGTVLLLCTATAQTPSNGPVSYAYDDLGRLIAVIDAGGNAAVYSYDAVGNILSIQRYTSSQISVITFTPDHGPEGASVTITGTGFSTTPAENTVQFNGVAATVSSATLTQLSVTVPAGATSGPITVTTPAGSAVSNSSFTVISNSQVPTITGFNPVIATPGTPITITGTNFNLTPVYNRLNFNGAPVAASSSTGTGAGASVPANAGSGRISLTTPFGTAVSSSDFFVPFGTHTAADVAYTGRVILGNSATVSLATTSKIGLLLFDAMQGENLNVQWSSGLTGCNIYLIAPGGVQLGSATCNSGSATISLPELKLPVTGTYTIGVEASSAGNIDIQTSALNDVTGTISIDGPPTSIATTMNGQDARLTFSGNPLQRVILQVTNVTNPAATVILNGVTGEPLSTLNINYPGFASFFMDTQTLVTSGKYTLWIKHVTGFGGETLQLSSVPPDITGTITIGGPAIRIPSSGNTAPGQNAIFNFDAVVGQKISLLVNNSTYPSGLCNVTLKTPSGSAFRGAFCYGASSFIDSVSLPTAGTYTILVDPQNTAAGTTTIQLNDDTDLVAPINLDGSPSVISPNIGQDARLTFSGTAGQRVFLRVTNVTNPTATVLLLKPDGSTLSSVRIGNSPAGQVFFIDTQTLSTTGTYTVWVQHSGANAGSETLQLTSVPADYVASLSQGIPLTVPASGNLAIGQNASLNFTGTAGSDLNLQFNNSTLGSTNFTVFNPDGSTLTTYNTSSSTFAVPTVLLPANGTYTVLVDPSGVSSGNFSVTLNLFGIAAPVPSRPQSSSLNPGDPLLQNVVGLFLMNEGSGTTDTDVVDGQAATFSGTTVPVWNTADPSVVFNGTSASLSSYLDAGTDLSFDQLTPNKMTVVAKIFLNSVTRGGIAEKTDDSSSGFTFGLDSTGALTAWVLKSGSPMRVSTGAGALTSGQWVQVAFTWDGTVGTAAAAHIYVNGVEQTNVVAQDGSGTINYAGATAKSLRIGNNSYSVTIGSLNGKMAYLAVYKYRVLTAAELNQLDAQLPITTDVVGTTTENGAATTVTTTTAGQNAHVSFQGWANQQATVQLSNNTMGQVTVSLIAPDGSTVATTASSATSFTLPIATLPLTGTYDVFVQGAAAPGSITVAVITNSGGRPTGSVIDPGNALSTNLVGLFLANEGTGTTDTNIVDGQLANFSSGATPATPPLWNTADPSVVFNGTSTSLSSYLDAGTDLNFDQLTPNKMTVVAKIFLNSVTRGGIAEKTDDSSSGFTFGLDSTGALTALVLKSGTPMRVSTGAGALTSGQWVQVAFTWDGTVGTAAAAHIYVNGVEQSNAFTQDGSGTINYAGATAKSLRIGNNSYSVTIGSLNGKMAYLAVYRGRILSNLELNQLDTQLPIH